jgi:glucokinase
VGWHGIEAAIAGGAGLVTGSIALIGFGADPLIESFAGFILLWRFAASRAASEDAERRAQSFGAGKDVEDLILVTLGNGVGGGHLARPLLRGARGTGGELGNITVQPAGPRCACGNRGCLEALAFGTAIARLAQKVAIEQPDSLLGRFAEERAPLGEDVLDLPRKGDDAAVKLLQESGIWLGIGLATFVNIFDPEVIAIGGGVSEAGDLVLELARREVRLRSHSPSRDLVEIREATLGAKSGMLGAAALARNEDEEYVLGKPATRRRAGAAERAT